MYDYLSFRLPEKFVESYANTKPPFGYSIGAGNSLGELTYLSKYSRRLDDGSKERWFQTCERVINGMYSILKDHCATNRTPWNTAKANKSAQNAYDRMFSMKFLPPGRGIWMMGTALVNEKRNSGALQNCSFLTTGNLSAHSKYDATHPFTRLMEQSMMGVGVGFDTRGAGKLKIHTPSSPDVVYEIEDSREGWVESVRRLLQSYLFPNQKGNIFIYDKIRPAGQPVKGFGGTAAGPGPLIALHESLYNILSDRDGQFITSTDIVDIMNLIGKCVVSGGIRRTAEIALGEADDKEFLNLKNWEVNPVRNGPNGWGHTSNNSVFAEVGGNYDHLIPGIVSNGEPGMMYLDLARSHGRLVDPPNNADYRVTGMNPCGEMPLESEECCTLCEVYLTNNDSKEDFLETVKIAYLYGKAVTLLATSWPETNEVMQRNRRVGCSVSGSAEFAELHSWSELSSWLNAGYDLIQHRDRKYSEWLGIRESIKTTTVKPSGTTSLICGSTPGVHWPVDSIYIRRIRLNNVDPLVEVLRQAGYPVEPDVMNPIFDSVVELPVRGPSIRSEKQVSIWEKAALAVMHQRFWADNQVSCTVTFDPVTEGDQIGAILRAFDGQLKSISFLPMHDGGAYQQMPYESISEEEYVERSNNVLGLDWDRLYHGDSLDAVGESFCNTDVCELKK